MSPRTTTLCDCSAPLDTGIRPKTYSRWLRGHLCVFEPVVAPLQPIHTPSPRNFRKLAPGARLPPTLHLTSAGMFSRASTYGSQASPLTSAKASTDSLKSPHHHAGPYAPPHLGIGSTEEVLATFSGEVAEWHPPTGPTTDAGGVEHPGKEGVRLLTWGDPYLTAWLETVRGEPLPDEDYRAIGVSSEINPLR